MKPSLLYTSALLLILGLTACQGPADTTPPSILASVPANGATGVATSTNLAITFSEPMSQASVTLSVSPALGLGAPVWNSPSAVAFDPPALSPGTTYTLSLEGKDLAGNPLSGPRTLTFQTAAPPDTIPPAAPTGVRATAGDGEFFVDWSPSPDPDLAGYTVYVGTAPGALLPAVFVDKPGTTAKVTGVDNGTLYHIAVEAQDTSSNRSPRSATATVTPRDMVAPTLLSSEPTNGAQNLALVPTLRFTFSEPMDPASLEIGLCVSDTPPASATCNSPSLASFGAPVWSDSDTQARLTPTDQLQSGRTHVLVVFARDKAGNPLSGPNQVAFSMRSTPDTAAPVVLSRNTGSTPTTGLGFVELTFSEPMDQQSVQAAFLSQPAIGCSWTWTGNTARCGGALQQLSAYTVTLGTGARDSAGNPLAAPYQFAFSTPNFNPRVLSFTPSSRFGAPLNVSPTAPIVLTFSEPMEQPTTQTAFQVRVGTTPVGGSFSWNLEGTQMTFTPGRPYGNGVTVSWRLGTGALELGAGRQIRLSLPAEVSGSFSTRPVVGP